MKTTDTLPIVDADKVLELFNEYRKLQDERYEEWTGNPNFDTIDKQTTIIQKLDKLVRDRINWLINYIAGLPEGQWNRYEPVLADDIFKSSKHCNDMIEQDALLHHCNLYGVRCICNCGYDNIMAIYVDDEDDGHYPTYKNIVIPLNMIVENYEPKVKRLILTEAIEQNASKIKMLEVECKVEKSCGLALKNILDKIGDDNDD